MRRLPSTILVLLVAACSGGSGEPSAQPPPPLTVTVDRGPEALVSSGQAAANILYTTVTVCTPGSTTQCQDVDHVQVDTGSTGLRLVRQALSGVVTPSPVLDPRSGLPIFECAVFADGYTWGSVVKADLVIAGRPIPGVALEMIGDPAAGMAPEACSGGNGPDEGTVAALGANGILGVGVFLQDCGPFCATQVPTSGTAPYDVCSGAGTAGASCTPTTVAVEQQVSNPVGLLPSDNNGVQIRLPLPASPGAVSVTGTLEFGLETSDANRLGSATLLSMDPGTGTLTTTYAGQSFDESVIDSGSSAYYFPDSSIAACSPSDPGNGFYCPPAALADTATITGGNGAQSPVSFTVANADAVFRDDPSDSAFPDLAGPLPGSAQSGRTFDWGLPFHFGRTVSILLEQRMAGAVTGPAVGF